jgi:uncharacterized damage-inducible protein DinB
MICLRAVSDSLLLALATNERINQYLLDHIDDGVWNAKPAGGSGRTVAAIVAHMHNVRRMWLKVVAKDVALPPKLERASVTRQEAKDALASSHAALDEVLRKSLEAGKVPNFSAGPAGFVSYLVAHDAHHRGQICMQVRQLGARLPDEVMIAMWDWPKRAKEVGAR